MQNLVRMANQIAIAFRNEPQDKAVAAAAEHIRLYWSRKMRADILGHLDAGGAGLEPATGKAIETLRESLG